tara:strand:+ start:288 stop:497 length:210 start_codon:yes stop_codon:yes gene_type:complete
MEGIPDLPEMERPTGWDRDLELLPFFEHVDLGNPYCLAAISNLQGEMAKHGLLSRDSEWFHTWSQGGKR